MKRLLAALGLVATLLTGNHPAGIAQELGEGFQGDLDIQPTDVIFWDPVIAYLGPGSLVTAGLRLRTEQNFTLYKDQVKFAAPPGFNLKRMEAPPTRTIQDPVSGNQVDVYEGGDFLLVFEGLEPWAENHFEVAVTYLGCTERICLFPYTERVRLNTAPATEEVLIAGSTASSSPLAAQKEAELSGSTPTTENDWEQDLAGAFSRGELSLGWLLVVLFVGGLATNLTPCVFPMIPITIRILSREGITPLISSFSYAAGIVVSEVGTVAIERARLAREIIRLAGEA